MPALVWLRFAPPTTAHRCPSAIRRRCSSPTEGLTIQPVSPARAPAAQETVITIQGSGLTAGAMLRVHFVPLASPNGAFDGLAATLVNPSTITVKVPAGRVVQDYVIQLTNGDGTVTSSRTAFTITP